MWVYKNCGYVTSLFMELAVCNLLTFNLNELLYMRRLFRYSVQTLSF